MFYSSYETLKLLGAIQKVATLSLLSALVGD
jgi:hypothetical protein